MPVVTARVGHAADMLPVLSGSLHAFCSAWSPGKAHSGPTDAIGLDSNDGCFAVNGCQLAPYSFATRMLRFAN